MSNNNNAAQTLFRFTSLRNPQLTDTHRRNVGFIHRPDGARGKFDDAVEGKDPSTSKMDALWRRGTEMSPEMFQSLKELEEGQFSQLLKIGNKISKKQEVSREEMEISTQYYRELIDKNGELNDKGLNIFNILWDNFIYQTATQRDFYLKDGIAHILKAFHIGFTLSQNMDEDFMKINGKEYLDRALNAKIVLPKELFSIDADTKPQSGSTISNATVHRLAAEMDKNIIVSNAVYASQRLGALKDELESASKSFYAAQESDYNMAYAEYQKENAERLAEYERQLAMVESQVKEGMSDEEIQRLYERLKEFEVPAFTYEQPEFLTLDNLQRNLSETAYATFIDYFAQDVKEAVNRNSTEGATGRAGDSVVQIKPEYKTLSQIISEAINQQSQQSQTALNNSALPQQQFVNIGGALVPVASSAQVHHLAYSLYAKSSRSIFLNLSFLNFSFEAEDDSWSVATATVVAQTDRGTVQETVSNVMVQNNRVTFPALVHNHFRSISAVSIQIFFSNGQEATLDLGSVPVDQTLTGLLNLKRTIEQPKENPKENPVENPRDPQQPQTKGRKNFGIKRLGIADYMKVVQSVHAYVPGEVSNIENVMASELRHKSSVSRDYSEVTDTTSKSQETEKISDTTKASRADMQTEIARDLEKQQSLTAHTSFHGGIGKAWSFDIGAEYANNTAQHDSTRQAVMKSQEITERAMERVLTKISDERIQKIIKEYTETNVHEFDNRGKVIDTDNPEAAHPQHITGVYRWIDKKMKNQIYNYGKRTSFEFMVPEPATLHRLATSVAAGQVLTAPIDPRKAPEPHYMPNAKGATKELLEYWAAIYNISLSSSPIQDIKVTQDIVGKPNSTGSFGAVGTPITIPQNYAAKSMTVQFYMDRNTPIHNSNFYCSNGRGGERDLSFGSKINQGAFLEDSFNLTNQFHFLYRGRNIEDVTLNITLYCKLSDAFIEQWQTENFNAIIAAYDTAYQKYLDEQKALDSEQKAKEVEAKEKQSNFYRYMEADTLKHNCIAYLLQDYLTTLGQGFTNGADKMEDFAVILDENLDKYTALAKFLEQAFEWEIMDYTFYPYYWAYRKKWQEMYISESVDPLFRSFLQAGMARVVVTVKPGFEDAVQFFLETGLIWNGGEVPVIGDPLYMSIVDEMREPTGLPQGKFWITRIPTTLTILQDKSTGLPVDQPLPIFPDDADNCENPAELETATSFRTDDKKMKSALGTESTLPKSIIKTI